MLVCRKQEPILSVDVGHFKTAGKDESTPKMSKRLQELLDLQPTAQREGHVYLGRAREKTTPDATLAKEKREMSKHLIDIGGRATSTSEEHEHGCGIGAPWFFGLTRLTSPKHTERGRSTFATA